MINHTIQSLIITLPTKTPELIHEQLMKALIAAIGWAAETTADVHHKQILLKLLNEMIPGEAVLEQGYKVEAEVL